MQAVILAAGKGTRMQPLTLEKPKQLVELNGKPLIEHIVNLLPESITEVILVIGYKGDMLQSYCGNTFCGRNMQYVWQDEALGTAHALEQAKHLLKDSFLLMYGDDIIDTASIEKAIQHKNCLLAFEHPDPRAFGVIELNEDEATMKNIVEKPEKPATNLVSASGLVLHTDLFDYYSDWPEGEEKHIPHVLNKFAQDNPVHIEILSFWQPINSIEQLKEAEKQIKG